MLQPNHAILFFAQFFFCDSCLHLLSLFLSPWQSKWLKANVSLPVLLTALVINIFLKPSWRHTMSAWNWKTNPSQIKLLQNEIVVWVKVNIKWHYTLAKVNKVRGWGSVIALTRHDITIYWGPMTSQLMSHQYNYYNSAFAEMQYLSLSILGMGMFCNNL